MAGTQDPLESDQTQCLCWSDFSDPALHLSSAQSPQVSTTRISWLLSLFLSPQVQVPGVGPAWLCGTKVRRSRMTRL